MAGQGAQGRSGGGGGSNGRSGPAPINRSGKKVTQTARNRFYQDEDGQWYDRNGATVTPEYDENGQILSPGIEGGLDPDQQIEALKHNQDPERFRQIENPYQTLTPREQFSDQAVAANMRLAESFLANQPGQEDYTINAQMRDSMSWDPSQQYQYEQDILQGRTDTTGLDAQRGALGQYGEIIGQGGLTAIDRAALMQSQQLREQELRGNREAIMRNAAEQGRGGGIAQLLQQGQASQQTANARAMDDARMQALALGRKDSAISAMGTLGGNIQTAQDALDRFNTQSRQDVQQRNVQSQQRGVDTRYNDEQSALVHNNNLANETERLNKSDAFGARGKWRERQNTAAEVMNQRTNFANHVMGREAAHKAEGREAANTITSALGVGASAAGAVAAPLAGTKRRREDEE
jgi:hypothetical protein